MQRELETLPATLHTMKTQVHSEVGQWLKQYLSETEGLLRRWWSGRSCRLRCRSWRAGSWRDCLRREHTESRTPSNGALHRRHLAPGWCGRSHRAGCAQDSAALLICTELMGSDW
ncbi:hypothetical protein AOXY_G35741 [Acipenser oxyrinchus oxyrinchus]|uniref:Uncharacterized protein n=1 Tax=Acipenser oxyrinchus oxyrinchus TaxID=40147 RepID=A0AAD8FQ83_ACIOX|nr:hypothetical protein AOXY_G35741 [Acipenser oxyrinchus oxyrinchus]